MESKKKAINHWMAIACTVYRAEANVQERWDRDLGELKDLPPEELKETTKSYIRAIAEEVVKTFTNEQIEKIYS